MQANRATAVFGKWVLGLLGGDLQIFPDHYVVVEDGLITAVTPKRPVGADIYELDDALVLPGFINAHNHCVSSILFRGLTEDRSFGNDSAELIYQLLMPLGDFAVDTLSAQQMRAVVELGLLEVIKGGTTTLFEVFRPAQVKTFDTAAEMGLRFYGGLYLLSTAKMSYDDGKIQHEARGTEGKALGTAVELYHRHDRTADGRIRVALAPHGTDTCDPDLLRNVRKAADELGCLITIHLSQSRPEVKAIRDRHGKSPAEYLADCGLLGPDLLAAHCIYSSDRELALLHRTDTTIVNCPRTFSRSGIAAPYGRFAAKGLRTVLGTDGYNMDIITEMRAAGIISKVHAQNSAVATAWDLVRAGTLAGAEALQRDDVGRIVPGARADIVVIDMARPHLQPVSDPIKTFVWNVISADVAAVMVDGEFLIRDGEFCKGEEHDIIRRGVAAVRKVWAEAEAAGIVAISEHRA